MAKDTLTKEEQDLKLKEIEFKKAWGRKCKLNPDLSKLKKDFGKAPKCNTRVKIAKVVETPSSKKKK